jgi:predicted nucleotidyltransferase
MELPLSRAELSEFCTRNRIQRLSLFGSYLHGDQRKDSDMDLVVEFEPAATVGYLDMARMEQELSGLLGGVKVDLRTPHELSRYFRAEVLGEAEVQYAQV